MVLTEEKIEALRSAAVTVSDWQSAISLARWSSCNGLQILIDWAQAYRRRRSFDITAVPSSRTSCRRLRSGETASVTSDQSSLLQCVLLHAGNAMWHGGMTGHDLSTDGWWQVVADMNNCIVRVNCTKTFPDFYLKAVLPDHGLIYL